MPISQVRPSEAEIKRWFIDVPNVTQELSSSRSSLGGTVSAGAYTAGAVDFLIEALDCFSQAQQEGKAPQHKVWLRVDRWNFWWRC